MDRLFIKNEIKINAPDTKVWDILTNPEMTKTLLDFITLPSPNRFSIK
jgi:carbon monoxide dehydrogenase subunit G